MYSFCKYLPNSSLKYFMVLSAAINYTLKILLSIFCFSELEVEFIFVILILYSATVPKSLIRFHFCSLLRIICVHKPVFCIYSFITSCLKMDFVCASCRNAMTRMCSTVLGSSDRIIIFILFSVLRGTILAFTIKHVNGRFLIIARY